MQTFMGFKRTELGKIPHEWQVIKLSEISEVKGRVGWRGYTQNDFVEHGDGAISLGANNITKHNKLIVDDLTFVTWEKYNESPEIQVCKDDIILAQRGSIGKLAFIDIDLGKTTINPNVVLIKKIKSNPKFLYYILSSELIKKQMFSSTSSTTIQLLTQEQIKNFKFPYPNEKEQQRIAAILSKVDELIQKTDQIIEQTQRLKKGLMQRLLTKGIGHAKFKKTAIGDIPEEWEVSYIGKECRLGTGGTPSRTRSDYFEGKIPWIKTTEINFKLITSSQEHITQQALEESSAKLYPSGILLMAMYGQGVTRGRCAILGIDAE